MELNKLLSIIPFYQANDRLTDIKIEQIEMNDKAVKENTLFVCIKGFTVDGHTFAKSAVEKGAVAVIAEHEIADLSVPVIIVPDTTRALALLANKFYEHPSDQLSLIGITGTNGKTTTTYLLEHIFQVAQHKTGVIGTIQTKIGDTVLPVKNTTPDALTLQKTFAEMVKHEVDTVAMEVSSHALHMGRVNECDFDIAVYMNLSQDHLDYHEDMASYLHAKSLLFSRLGNRANEENKKYAIINIDDPYSEEIEQATAQYVVTYGFSDKAQVQVKQVSYSIDGTEIEIGTPIGILHIKTSLIGKFNVYNMLAAISVAIVKGIDLSTIKSAMQTIHGVDGRFEKVDCDQDYAVIVDYAHTPDSLENVLLTIRQFAENNIYVVVGTGGDRDRTKRPLMADIAIKYADKAIFTTDNPRTEDPKHIIEDMIQPLADQHFEVVYNRKEAIEYAVSQAKSGDVILIAGKGHETYQEIHGVRYDFDDRLIAKAAIEQKEQ